jgi:hypothetical protein
MEQHRTDAERDLDELRDAVLDDWLTVTSNVTDALQAIQQTVSWRVTRPLRTAKLFSNKAKEVGVVPAGRLAAVEVARRLVRR